MPAAGDIADAVAAVTALAVACGADPVVTDPETHDRWVALVSHAPHLVAAAMAARLAPVASPRTRSGWPAAACATSPGSRRATARCGPRSCPRTPGPVAEVVAAVAEDLAAVARLLAACRRGTQARTPGVAAVTGLLDRGRAGAGRIPGKHGGQPRNFTMVQVVIADRPGELSRLFTAAGAAGVNIEDIRLEHSPGLPVGVAELSVRPDQAGTLLDAMEAGGWPVRR